MNGKLLPEVVSQLYMEDRKSQMRFTCFVLALKFIQFALGFETISQLYMQLLVSLIIIFLLWKKKAFEVNVLLFLVNCIIPSLMYDKIELNLLALPVQMIVFPVYCMMVARSTLLAAIATVVNAFILLLRIQPILTKKLLYSQQQQLREGVQAMMISCIECGLLVFLSFVFQIGSREKYLVQVYGNKKNVSDLNDKLENMNGELSKGIKNKDDFLLNISHELRNPINTLLGNLELAMAASKDAILSGYLENAKFSGELLTFLINNLLDAGKLQNQKLEITPVPTNTLKFIERTWSACRLLIQKKNLEGQIFIQKTIPERLLVDAHRLTQILLNLVSNATKFTVSGGILIIVSWIKEDDYNEQEALTKTPNELFDLAFNAYNRDCITEFNDFPKQQKNPNADEIYRAGYNMSTDEELADNNSAMTPNKYSNVTVYKTFSYLELMKLYYKLDYNFPKFANVHHVPNTLIQPSHINDPSQKHNENGYLKIEVKDTGSGMTPESAMNIFKKYSQIEVMPGRHIGTGLGLWITHNLCTNMGGDIKAFGEPNVGSTFVATIKCKNAVSTNGRGNNRIQRAMVVDDIVANQRLNKYFLETQGVQVTDLAFNGLEAFEIYAKKGNKFFDMIYMDIDMPIKSGSEAIKKIRDYERRFRWRPVIMTIITGACSREECETFKDPQGEVRADFVFQKPFGLHQCIDLIEQLNNQSEPSEGSDNVRSSEEPSNPGKKCKRHLVLIIDDDTPNVKLMTEFLSKQGVESISASNGKDGVEKYRNFHADIKLIIMDTHMPVMDGFTATEKIRELIDENIWPNIKIVALTANANDDSKKKCRKAGMNLIVTKPISYGFLQSVIDKYMHA
jgi:signal transduction histidine kinase/CheY-like chemotaxis protein